MGFGKGGEGRGEGMGKERGMSMGRGMYRVKEGREERGEEWVLGRGWEGER